MDGGQTSKRTSQSQQDLLIHAKQRGKVKEDGKIKV